MKFMYTPQGRAFIISCLFLLFSFNTLAQVGIGNTNPNNDALLEIGDATTTTKGLLLPRVNLVNTSNFAPMTAHVQGMVVYNKNTAGDVTPGYYYNDGSQWVRIAASSVPSNDWTTTGNTGTTGGTGVGQNYLGTTDGEALIIATQATQRMRLLANGQIVINDTGAPIAGDRLTVQGSNNEDVINGYAIGSTGVAIYGESAAFDAIVGNAARYGVVGLGVTGVYGSGTIYGNYGTVNNATGMGIRAVNLNASGTGLLASGNNVVGTYLLSGSGVAASGDTGVFSLGATYGNYATVDNATGMGVRSVNSNALGTGILSSGNNATGNYLISGSGIAGSGATGVYGKSNTNSGTGIIGSGNNSTSIITNTNGGGVAGSGTRNGVFGYAGLGAVANGNRGNAGGIFMLDTDNNVSNNGANNNNGIRASAVIAGFDNIAFNDNATPTPTSYPAQDSYFGGYFSGGTERTGGAATTPSYAYVGLRYNTATDGLSGTDFKIVGPGNVSTIINDEKNVPRIMFAPEAPEIVFQDYGVGQLVNGQVYIALDPVLKNSLHIDSEHPLKVFVTLEGDCNGVYVTNKSADGFTVKELQNGTSNVSFSWQIVANRADTKDANGRVVSKHVGLRLPEGPGPLNLTAKNNESITDTRKIEIKTPVKSQLQEVVKTPIKSNGANAASADMINNELQTQPTSTPSEVPVENLNTPTPSDILNTKEK